METKEQRFSSIVEEYKRTIYTQSAPDENMLFPTAIYIFTCVAGVLFSVKTYRKKMEACDNLIESLENE